MFEQPLIRLQASDNKYVFYILGKRSKLQILENTLSLTLKENNTIVIGAKIFAEVTAKTWIWKGISFGLLGCLKISSCNGQVVTYSANIDTKVSFQVLWEKTQEKMAITIKPVETELEDVRVQVGCEKLVILHLYPKGHWPI